MSDPVKAASRAHRRNKLWEERQERSRASRDEVHEVQRKIDELRAMLAEQSLAAAADADSSSSTNAVVAVVEQQQVLVDDLQQQTNFTLFTDLPLSSRTLQGLERGNYTHMTRIQAVALPAALCGRDLLGAARTGSGKTLTFLIPVLERLWREQWDSDSGVGALILSPTRELALQTFKVLQVIGIRHTLSAALLTGGRNVDEEKARLHAINIVVGTPGRVLHHMTEASGLVVDNLQVLVLDEADRLLDMGFRETVTGILEQLPQPSADDDEDEDDCDDNDDNDNDDGQSSNKKKNNNNRSSKKAASSHRHSFRQTLLFSATQTRDVQMLGKLCMGGGGGKNKLPPLFITDHPSTVAPTPTKMCQNFIVVDLHRKLDLLLLFLRRHPHDKIVVFASTQNQVRFMFLAFSQLLRKTKIPAMCLTGKMKQFRREEVFLTFCRCKAAVLFCTDLAARGLDFPMVHWVVQFDCPESPQTYVHRAGRTARAGARGVNLLFLTPSETAMLAFLHHKNVPMREIAVKEHLMVSTRQMFVALAVQGLKLEAQKACVGYLRSLHFAENKHVFKLDEVDVQAFAESLGLNAVPDLGSLAVGRSAQKNLPWDVQNYMREQQQKKEQQQQQGTTAAGVSGGGNGSDEDDDGNGKNKSSKADKTRRERHLEASDMFTALQKAQRFNANKDKSFLGGDEDDAAATAAAAKKKKKQQQQKDKLGGDDGDDDDGDELFTRRRLPPSTAAAAAAGSSSGKQLQQQGADDIAPLTAAERMAGLSKHKQRRLVQSADLRVKDLNLNTRMRFADSDGEDDDNDAIVANLSLPELVVAPTPKVADTREYIASLQQRVQSAAEEDKMRVRERKLSKMGRQRKEDRENEEDDDNGDYHYDDGQSDDSSGDDGDLDALLKAARGELYNDDDDDEDEGGEHDDDEDEDAAESSEEDESVAPVAKKKFTGRHAAPLQQQQQQQQQQQGKRHQQVGGRANKPNAPMVRRRKEE